MRRVGLSSGIMAMIVASWSGELGCLAALLFSDGWIISLNEPIHLHVPCSKCLGQWLRKALVYGRDDGTAAAEERPQATPYWTPFTH